MSVYNGADVVGEAIASIQSQTFADYEFIIVDDGSDDGTAEILSRHAAKDPRIVLLHHDNRGLTRSLNRGVKAARADLVARQDADDLSLPERLARQVAFMDAHRHVLLLGTAAFDGSAQGRTPARITDRSRLGESIYLHNPFAHTSVMFRRTDWLALGGYDESFDTSQDFELWMRFAERGAIDMLEDPLVVRRLQEQSISRRKRLRQVRNGFRARLMHPRHGTLRALTATAYQALSSSAPDWLIATVRAARGRRVERAPDVQSS
jgi:glycosyltransferase involved in cell wall biosynthesis